MEYKKPSLTTDVVLFTFTENKLKVLLIQRGHPPFAGDWAFPGGFLDYGEPPAAGALRELQEETGVTGVMIEQLGTFGDPDRDPRGHTVSIVFMAFIDASRSAATGSDDAADARWFDVTEPPHLAFDHAKVFSLAIENFRRKFLCPSELLGFLPENLTVSDVRKIEEILTRSRA